MTRVYLVIGHWPFSQLTNCGKLASCRSCGSENHIGIYFEACSESQIRAHSDPAISHESARKAVNVTFDYMADLYPRFQSCDREAYWTPECVATLYPILGVDADRLHDVCVRLAHRRPFNNQCTHRINAALGGCWPCSCTSSNTDVAPSTCVALSMRAIAAARSGSDLALTNDTEAIRVLRLPQGACQPVWLVGYTPANAVNAMRNSERKLLGGPMEGFHRGKRASQMPLLMAR